MSSHVVLWGYDSDSRRCPYCIDIRRELLEFCCTSLRSFVSYRMRQIQNKASMWCFVHKTATLCTMPRSSTSSPTDKGCSFNAIYIRSRQLKLWQSWKKYRWSSKIVKHVDWFVDCININQYYELLQNHYSRYIIPMMGFMNCRQEWVTFGTLIPSSSVTDSDKISH